MVNSYWEQHFKATLPVYGHRNWIVVADSAYPAQSRPGIETITSGAEIVDVLRKVVDGIRLSTHVRANVYLDKELAFVAEADAAGVTKYRQHLAKLLKDSNRVQLPHEEIIARLDQVSQIFNVLIIKTRMTIPYTSVFFELDCAYWPSDAEKRLKLAISKAK